MSVFLGCWDGVEDWLWCLVGFIWIDVVIGFYVFFGWFV